MLHVKECSTMQQVGKKVKRIYAKLSTAKRVRLYEKLLTVRLNDGDDARAHVHELARMRMQLGRVGGRGR